MYLLNDIHALYDLSEDDMLIVQPSSLHRTDEELRAVGVRTGVGHRQNAYKKLESRRVAKVITQRQTKS